MGGLDSYSSWVVYQEEQSQAFPSGGCHSRRSDSNKYMWHNSRRTFSVLDPGALQELFSHSVPVAFLGGVGSIVVPFFIGEEVEVQIV